MSDESELREPPEQAESTEPDGQTESVKPEEQPQDPDQSVEPDEPTEGESDGQNEPDEQDAADEAGEPEESDEQEEPAEPVEPEGPQDQDQDAADGQVTGDQDLHAQTGRARSRIIRKVRNVAISAVILFILLLGAGVAYIKFEGGGNTQPAPVSQTQTPSEVVQPPKISPRAAEGVAVSSISSTVAHGAQASVTVNTNAGSKCSIALTHDNAAMAVSSLKSQTADAYGVAGWTWTVNQTAPAGVWKANVTCIYHKRSGVVIGSFKVT